MPKFVMVVFVVCDPPVSVTSGNVGIAGTVENASVPAFTENSVLSSCVAPSADVAGSAAAKQASTSAGNACRRERLMWMLLVIRAPCASNVAAAASGHRRLSLPASPDA